MQHRKIYLTLKQYSKTHLYWLMVHGAHGAHGPHGPQQVTPSNESSFVASQSNELLWLCLN